MPFVGVRLVGGRKEKGIQETERTLKQGMGSWWMAAHIYRATTVSLRTTHDTVVGHVFGTALTGSVNWPWSGERVMRVKRWETKVLRVTFRPRTKAGEEWVEDRKRNSKEVKAKWRKMQLPTRAVKIAEKVWKTMAWASCDGDVLVMNAPRSTLRWQMSTWWRNRSAWCMRADPINVSRWKHKWCFHNVGVVWDTPMARWAGDGRDSAQEMFKNVRPRKMR